MNHLADMTPGDARSVGSGAAQEVWMKKPELNKVMNIEVLLHLKYAFAFGLVAMPSPVVTLSDKPGGGVTQVCLPFLNFYELLPQNTELVDKMRDSLGILVFGLAHLLATDLVADKFLLTRVWHKAETRVDQEGDFWFNKACASERVATVIKDPSTAHKHKKWYAYLGGGAVDSEQTELVSGLVIITKNWEWAALTVVASWLLSCTCECGELSWPNAARIIPTEAWEETVDPLDDEAAAGDGVQQPQLQKPEDLFLEKCEHYRIMLMGILIHWPHPCLYGEAARTSLDTAACRQQMQEWWNTEMVTNTGFSCTTENDENERAGEKGKKAAKGAKWARKGYR